MWLKEEMGRGKNVIWDVIGWVILMVKILGFMYAFGFDLVDKILN